MTQKEKLLDLYLKGTIEGKDLKDMETLLASDQDFAKELATQLAIRKAVRKEQIAKFEKINESQKRLHLRPMPPWLIALFALLAMIALYLKNDPTNTTEKVPLIQEPKDSVYLKPVPPIKDTMTVIPEKPMANTDIQKQKSKTSNNNIPKAEILTISEREEMLRGIAQRENRALKSASGQSWQSAFLNNQTEQALLLIRKEISENSGSTRTIQYYFAGILELYAKKGEAKKAIQYLVKSNQRRPDVNLHLIIAYAKNDQLENAKTMLKNEPKWQEELPESMRSLYTELK